MIVIHFESGLGNQMLNYAEYLAAKSTHPHEEIYFENIVYELGDSQNKINMWNGYELERIFGIKMHNISEKFTHEQWNDIVNTVRESRFWDKGWNYSQVICDAFSKYGVNVNNKIGIKKKESSLNNFYKTRLGYFMKRLYSHIWPDKVISKKAFPDRMYLSNESGFYTGQKLLFLYKNNDIEKISEQLISDFEFPDFDDVSGNRAVCEKICGCNSVALHIRRSDMLYANGYLYKYGYFKRAVKLIRKKISNPHFFVFGDTSSADWIKENPARIGLTEKDEITYVDWNKDSESFRDMQLMTYCKGVIITNSTFGWWGAFLNKNKDKVTISPFVNYNTTHWT